MNELKNLQCQGMTMMGAALKHAFDVLNINRMQTGIDTYGQGRCPFFLEPAVIVVITDGSKLSNTSGVQEDVSNVQLGWVAEVWCCQELYLCPLHQLMGIM